MRRPEEFPPLQTASRQYGRRGRADEYSSGTRTHPEEEVAPVRSPIRPMRGPDMVVVGI